MIVFILGLTAFQMAQGMYSSIINMLLVMFAAVVTMNFFEPLGCLIDQDTGHGEGIAIIALFALSFAGLRAFVDWKFKNDIGFPKIIDKVGSAAAGFVTAMIGAGVVMIGLQLLPLSSDIAEVDNPERFIVQGASVAGYDLYPARLSDISAGVEAPVNNLSGDAENLWLQPDRFVLGLFSLFSETGLAGRVRFTEAHPDLLQEAYAYRCTPHYQEQGEESRDMSHHLANAEHVKVTAFQFDPPKDLYAKDEYEKRPKNKRLLLVKVHVEEETKDDDGALRFCGLQVLLQTVTGSGKNAVVRNRFPCGWYSVSLDVEAMGLHIHTPRDAYPCDAEEQKKMTGAGRDLLLLFALDESAEGRDVEKPAGLQFKSCGPRPFPLKSSVVKRP